MNLLSKSFLLLLLLPQTAVPVDQEPRHHVVFENQYVRVIDAKLPADDTTLYHTHARDNVPVALAAGKMQIQVLGGEPTEADVAVGQVSYAKATYTHQIHNSGGTDLRFIDVEIVSSPGGAPELAPIEGNGMTMELENEHVRVYRVKLGPGESTGTHHHSQWRLGVVVEGGKVRLGTGETIDVQPGQYGWYAPSDCSIENVGENEVEGVIIEWK